VTGCVVLVNEVCAARGDRNTLASSREKYDMFAEKCTTNKLLELKSSLKMQQQTFPKCSKLCDSAVKGSFILANFIATNTKSLR
jgi:hypothetical protein